MARETLFKGHVTATQKTNVANTLTEMIVFKVPDRVAYTILDGTVLKMKLRDASNVEISGDSEIVLAGLEPGGITPKSIDKVLYDAWKELTLAEQADIANQAGLRLSIPGGGITFTEQNEIIFMVKADRVISWSNSSLTFDVQKDQINYI